MTYREIEEIRKRIGCTKEAFAEVLGVSLSTYYSWSQPERSPCGSTLELLRHIQRDPVSIYAELRNNGKTGEQVGIR